MIIPALLSILLNQAWNINPAGLNSPAYVCSQINSNRFIFWSWAFRLGIAPSIWGNKISGSENESIENRNCHSAETSDSGWVCSLNNLPSVLMFHWRFIYFKHFWSLWNFHFFLFKAFYSFFSKLPNGLILTIIFLWHLNDRSS